LSRASCLRALSTSVPVHSAPAMFCFQCEQTEKATGCTTIGVCGKTAQVSRLQDLLLAGNKSLALYMHELNKMGKTDNEIDQFVLYSSFSTLTNGLRTTKCYKLPTGVPKPRERYKVLPVPVVRPTREMATKEPGLSTYFNNLFTSQLISMMQGL
jgi:hypothetical protein